MELPTLVNLSDKAKTEQQVSSIITSQSVLRDITDLNLMLLTYYKSVNLFCKNCGTHCTSIDYKCNGCQCVTYCGVVCMISDLASHDSQCIRFRELISQKGYQDLCYKYVSLCKQQIEYGLSPRKAKLFLVICDLKKDNLAQVPCVKDGYHNRNTYVGPYARRVSKELGRIREETCGEFAVFVFVNPENGETCIDSACPCSCCNHDKCFERLHKYA